MVLTKQQNRVQWNPFVRTPLGLSKISLIERCPHFRVVNVVLGTEKSVLLLGVSSIQGCPYRVVPLYPLSSLLLCDNNYGQRNNLLWQEIVYLSLVTQTSEQGEWKYCSGQEVWVRKDHEVNKASINTPTWFI